MSYRILVDSEAGQALRTFSGHVLERAGRLLAELSEGTDEAGLSTRAPSEAGAKGRRKLDLTDCVLLYEIDATAHTLHVLAVEPRAGFA